MELQLPQLRRRARWKTRFQGPHAVVARRQPRRRRIGSCSMPRRTCASRSTRRPQLHADPKAGLRHSPIKAAVLTNGDVDHIIGLINLREAQPFSIYASERVLDTLRANSVFQVLAEPLVPRIEIAARQAVQAGRRRRRPRPHGRGLRRARQGRAVPGGRVRRQLRQPARATPSASKLPIRPRRILLLHSRLRRTSMSRSRARLKGASLVFFDGTLFTDDEMLEQGLMNKTGARMGHISMSGAAGSIAAFSKLGVGRLIYVHINNSNPVLDENSPERKATEGAGWEVGYDGMEVRL